MSKGSSSHKSNASAKRYRDRWNSLHPEGRKAFSANRKKNKKK
jgi:hypothetical protein